MEPAVRARAAAQRASEFQTDLEEFAAHLATLMADGAERTDAHVDDLYLAWCCTTGCERALAALWERHVPALRRAASSVLGEPAADDVVQTVLHRLLVGSDGSPGAIADFRGTSRLARWLRAITIRQALTVRRGDRREVEGEPVFERLAADGAGPELALMKQVGSQTIEAALRRAIGVLAPHERLVLQQHLVDGLTIDELATLYRIHRATAARRIAGAREALTSALRRDLRASLQLSDGELDSLIELAHSRVHISLRWFG